MGGHCGKGAKKQDVGGLGIAEGLCLRDGVDEAKPREKRGQDFVRAWILRPAAGDGDWNHALP